MKKSSLALAVVMTATLAILVLIFGKVMLHPNSYIFSTSVDAVKSYFNFSYYLKYDQGIRHDGINYPYGDHLQYINSHPLYSQMLKLAGRVFPLSDKGVGILNLTMIFSLLAAVPFIFLVLRKFRLPPWYAALVTLIILFLSPQIDRLGGHFEMVYAFFIPLYWYLLIRWDEGKRRGLWTILLLFTALVGGFTSAYYVAFLAIFTLAVLLVQLWNHRGNLKGYLAEGLQLLAIAVIPLVVVKGLVSATDWVDDRPDNPWGFFVFHSNLFSIFLPLRSILGEVLQDTNIMDYKWEGRAYVGFPATLLAIGFLLTALWVLFTLKRSSAGTLFRPFNQGRQMNLYLAAAILVLLFAMCIPFKWLRFLPDLLPALKQFRCLGRFSWIFYYVFTVYTALFIYRMYRSARMKGFRVAAFVALTILLSHWGLEAAQNVKISISHLYNSNRIITFRGQETEQALSQSGMEAGDFQAIFFLPYANTCGDKLFFTRGMHAFSQAMKCSYQTGIPLIQSFSPRLSFSQAMSSIQLLADSAIYKTRVDDMDERPVLLVVTGEQLNRQEQVLLGRAKQFWQGAECSLSALPVEAFNAEHENWLSHALSLADSLEYRGTVGSDVEAEMIHYDGFESFPARNRFTGRGARFDKKGSFELFSGELFPVYGSRPVEFSFWLYTDSRIDNMPVPELWKWEGEDRLVGKEELESRTVHNVDGMWVRIETTLVPEPGIRYQLTIRGKYITVDDLLVKPAGASVAVRGPDGLSLFDNFRVSVGGQD